MTEANLSERNEIKQMCSENRSVVGSIGRGGSEEQKIGRGRPKSRPPSKLVSFHLPLNLIDVIEIEAADQTGGNKSLFVIKLLEGYLESKKQ